jgi:hypothetical protein
MNIERVRAENFDNRLKTIETKNLKKTGSSLSWASLSNHFRPCILEILMPEKVLIVDKDKYKEIRKQVLK